MFRVSVRFGGTGDGPKAFQGGEEANEAGEEDVEEEGEDLRQDSNPTSRRLGEPQ